MEKRKKLEKRAGVRNTGSSGNERAAGVDVMELMRGSGLTNTEKDIEEVVEDKIRK